MKITKKTTIEEALELNKKTAEILVKAGMMCVSCPMSRQETIENGCLAHGMSNKEIDKFIERLNKDGEKKKKKIGGKKRK